MILTNIKSIDKYLFWFCFGGIAYGLIEVAFRGYTHWSMIITGGSAVLSLFIINESTRLHILLKALIGTTVITALELSVGIIINKIFNYGVWDYTNLPFNFMGQISLIFSACWYLLSFVSFVLFEIIQRLTSLPIRDKFLHRVTEHRQ